MQEPTARKVPQIRFKGFDEEWAEKALGEITTYKNGKGHENRQSSYGKYELINLNSISISGGLKYSGKFIDDTDETLNADDLVMILSDVAHGNLLGRVARIPENDRFVLNQRVALLRPWASKSSTYLLYQINARQSYFKLRGAGMSQLNISKNVVTEFTLFTPAEEEQTKIGEYFLELDSLIALHQRKHDKLVTLKKAMLQKMFPQAGATTPEIRFKGFSGDWVEKRLDDVCDIVGGGTPSTSIQEYWGGSIDWYSPTEIGDKVYASGSVKKITLLGLSKSSARLLPPEKTVLFTSRAGIGDMAILTKEGCTNQGFQSFVLNDDIDPYLIFSMGHLIKIHALKHASGSTFLEVSSKQLGKMKILLPKENEQQKIGTYFRTLDELISQHATQLQKLKQLKSACLEKMFV